MFSDSSITQVDSLGPRIDVDLFRHALHAAEERHISATVDGGLPGSDLEPPPTPDTERFGLTCEFKGAVVRADHGELMLDTGGRRRRVKLLMPPGLDFGPLAGHPVVVRHRLEIDPLRSITIDLSIRNRYGDLLLWARDGVLPHARHAQGHTIRVAHEGDEAALVVSGIHGPQRVPTAASAVVPTAQGRFVVLSARVRPGDAAFVLVRKYF